MECGARSRLADDLRHGRQQHVIAIARDVLRAERVQPDQSERAGEREESHDLRLRTKLELDGGFVVPIECGPALRRSRVFFTPAGAYRLRRLDPSLSSRTDA